MREELFEVGLWDCIVMEWNVLVNNQQLEEPG